MLYYVLDLWKLVHYLCILSNKKMCQIVLTNWYYYVRNIRICTQIYITVRNKDLTAKSKKIMWKCSPLGPGYLQKCSKFFPRFLQDTRGGQKIIPTIFFFLHTDRKMKQEPPDSWQISLFLLLCFYSRLYTMRDARKLCAKMSKISKLRIVYRGWSVSMHAWSYACNLSSRW